MFLHQYLIFLNKPTTPSVHYIAHCAGGLLIANVERETCTALLSVVFGSVPTQKNYILLEL